MTETPVSSEELSSVLAKRLFVDIDTTAAKATAEQYRVFYAKHKDQSPPRCTRATSEGGSDYAELITKYYPFHPTLVDFLNKKLERRKTFRARVVFFVCLPSR